MSERIRTPQKIATCCSSTPLDNGETFTGGWNRCEFLPSVIISLKTDQSGILYLDFSSDGETAQSTLTYNVAANINEVHQLTVSRSYFRCRFTNNSGSNQTTFSLETIFGYQKALTAPNNLTLGLDSDSLSVRPSSHQDEIRLGLRSGVTGWNKFAYRTGLTVAGGEQTIWDYSSGNFTSSNILTTASTFTIAYDGTAGGSTDGAGTTGARELTIFYNDSDGLPAIATHTLGTDGSDETSFSGLGINRVAVSEAGSSTYNNSDIIITATTGGTVQAVVPAQDSVTQQAIFHVGSNHQAIAKYLWVNVLKTVGGSSPRVEVKGYVFNRSLSIRYIVFTAEIDTGVQNTLEITDPIGFNLSPNDVLYFTASTSTNDTRVDLRFSLNQYQNN